MKKIIEDTETKVDEFKENIEEVGLKAEENFDNEMAVIEKKDRNLKKKLEEYKGDGQRKWNNFKTNLKQNRDGIGRTLKKLFKDNA